MKHKTSILLTVVFLAANQVWARWI